MFFETKLPFSRTDSNPWPQFLTIYKIEYKIQNNLLFFGNSTRRQNHFKKISLVYKIKNHDALNVLNLEYRIELGGINSTVKLFFPRF
jgi:hypothetical protein